MIIWRDFILIIDGTLSIKSPNIKYLHLLIIANRDGKFTTKMETIHF